MWFWFKVSHEITVKSSLVGAMEAPLPSSVLCLSARAAYSLACLRVSDPGERNHMDPRQKLQFFVTSSWK